MFHKGNRFPTQRKEIDDMKKWIAFVLFSALSFGMLNYVDSPIKVIAETDPITITSQRNHLLLDVDETIDLDTVTVSRIDGDFTLSDATLTSTFSEVVLTETTLTVTEKGIFTVSVSYSEFTMTLYVITKLDTETEYVIYQEDFSTMSGALPMQFSMLDGLGEPGGSAAIVDNRLFLSGNTIVLFPSYLQGFTNYIIEADVNMTRVDNSSRWTSIMFRYTKENYFQMAVRQTATATNGVEFAKRISGSWNVPATVAYKESLGLATTYRFKVDVFETTVNEYINDEFQLTYDSAYEFTYGRIGVQTNGSDVYFDNILIRLPEDYIAEAGYEFKQVVDVYQPETGIVNPATTIVWAESVAHVDELIGDVRPATVILRVNSALNIVDQVGTFLMSLEDALIKIDGKVIPAFYVDNVTTAEGLANMLREFRIFDAFIISQNKDVILAARTDHSLMRGVLHMPTLPAGDLTLDQLMDIRRETNRAQAVAVILPGDRMTKDYVFEMQRRAMTIWVTAQDDIASQYRAILSGAQGIVTQDFESLFNIYATFPENTMVRRPLMIAHRGLYNGGSLSTAPENTIEGALESYAKGADIIELDVHLSLDLEVVVIHDGTTERTANAFPSLTVAQATVEQLKEVYLTDVVNGSTEFKIPTLREYLLALKGEDVVFFIEPKPTQSLLMELVADLIEELDMYDQAAIIAFSAANIETMNTYYPEISNGLLNSGLLNASNLDSSLTNVFSNIVTINSTLNPNFGALRPELVNALIHRGVTVWPWTLNDFATLDLYYIYGVNGITTDFFTYYDQTYNRLTFNQYKYSFILGESSMFNIRGQIETQSGTSYPYMPNLIVIDDGGTGITFDINGHMLTIENEGNFYAYTIFSSNLPNGTVINILSDIFEINSMLPEPEPSEPTEPVEPTTPDEPEEPGTNQTIVTIIIITGSTIALGVGAFFGIRRLKLRP